MPTRETHPSSGNSVGRFPPSRSLGTCLSPCPRSERVEESLRHAGELHLLRLYGLANAPKDAERLLVSIDQDLIHEAPMIPYTRTEKGARRLQWATMTAMGIVDAIFLFAMLTFLSAGPSIAVGTAAAQQQLQSLSLTFGELVALPSAILVTYVLMARRTLVLDLEIQPLVEGLQDSHTEAVYLVNSEKSPASAYLARLLRLDGSSLRGLTEQIARFESDAIANLQEQARSLRTELDSAKVLGAEAWSQSADLQDAGTGPSSLHPPGPGESLDSARSCRRRGRCRGLGGDDGRRLTMMGLPLRVLVVLVTLGGAWLAPPGPAVATPQDFPAVQYFRLAPGTPTESGTTFDVPVFVLGEPAGAGANGSETKQAWQDLQVEYLGPIPGPFENWSVPSWGAGRFDLHLVLTNTEVSAIEDGQAILALNSSIVVDGSVLGASGQVDGPILSSSVVAGTWWNTIFGIPTPPPDPSLSSVQGILDDLAWFGSSTAGRAAYAATTIVAVMLYLWEGHKLARAKLLGPPSRSGRRAL